MKQWYNNNSSILGNSVEAIMESSSLQYNTYNKVILVRTVVLLLQPVKPFSFLKGAVAQQLQTVSEDPRFFQRDSACACFE
jgi:hypothetical protein